MSLARITSTALFLGVSFFALNASAADQTNPASAAATPAAATAAPAAGAHATAAHKAAAAKVDINSADVAALSKVKGVGKNKAEAIVAYRTKNGAFKSVEDLKNVTNAKGKAMFAERTVKRLEGHLVAGGAQA